LPYGEAHEFLCLCDDTVAGFRRSAAKDDIPAVFYKHYPAFSAGKMNLSELARVCDLSRPTVYKYLKLIA